MTSENKVDRRRARRGLAREAFILMAMALVSVAVGFGVYVQLGLSLMAAGLTGLVVYLGCLATHALVHRSEAIRELSYEVDRLENEVMRMARSAGPVLAMPPAADQPPHLRPAPPPGPAPAGFAHARPQQPPARPGPAPAQAPGPNAEHAARAGAPSQVIVPPPQGMAPGFRPTQEGGPSHPVHLPAAANGPVARSEPVAAGAAPGHPDRRVAGGQASAPPEKKQMARFWSVRPADAVAEAPRPGAAAGAPAVRPGPTMRPVENGNAVATAPGDARAPGINEGVGKADALEASVDAINEMIQKYSEEIGLPDTRSRATADRPLASQGGPDAAISASVDALRAAVGEMRRPGDAGSSAIERGILPPLRVDPKSAASQPPPVGPGHAQMAALADAIATQKFDVYLQPIMGLADRKARHYEVSLQLRTGPGTSVGPEHYIPMAAGNGMLPLVDAGRVARAARVAQHLDERGSGGCVFSSVSAQSLGSERFLNEFAELCRQAPRLRERLVLSLSQGELRGLSPAQWATVKQLAANGIRFAIEDVTSLDLDLPELRTSGFVFMRVAARALLDGLAGLDGPVPTGEVGRRLTSAGLTLMAVDLRSEDQLDGILGAGVPLGQGSLFGMPRPIRAEALRTPNSAAA